MGVFIVLQGVRVVGRNWREPLSDRDDVDDLLCCCVSEADFVLLMCASQQWKVFECEQTEDWMVLAGENTDDPEPMKGQPFNPAPNFINCR